MFNTRYFWNFFASGLYSLAFTFSIIASLIIGFSWPIIIFLPIVGTTAALCISSFREGCFYHDKHLKELCQRDATSPSSEKQLLKG